MTPHLTPSPEGNGALAVVTREECERRERAVERQHEEDREAHKEIWAAINATNQNVQNLAVSVGSMSGKMIGYTAAAVLTVGIVSFIASKVLTH